MTPLNEDLLRASRRFDAAGRPITRNEVHRLAWALRRKPLLPRLAAALRATTAQLRRTAHASLLRALRAYRTAAPR